MYQLRPLLGYLIVLLLVTNTAAAIPQNDSLEPIIILHDGYSKTVLYLPISQSFKSTNIDSAIFYADRSRISALRDDDDKGVAEALFILGKINLRQDSTISARENFNFALKYTEECECDSLVSTVYLFLGKSFLYRDNYSEAIINYMNSLRIAEEMEYTAVLADLYDDIGLVMLFLDDSDQALVYFKKALEISQNSGNKKNHATSLRNIGFIHLSRHQYKQALEHFMKALKLYEEINYFPGMATATIGIGNVEFLMENYQNALNFYKDALEIANKVDIKFRTSSASIKASAYDRLGEANLKLGRFNNAINALRKASDISEKYGFPGSKADASHFFSQVYERMGDTILAFEYFKTYIELSDSIVNARNVSAITRLEMEYQYLKQQKEREIKRLKTEAAYKRKVLLYEILIGVSVIMLVLLIVILVLYRKNQRNKSKHVELVQKNLELEKENLQKELEYKNKELTTSVMYQLKKNNFIWSISEKLKDIAMHLRPEMKKTISEIIKEMDANMTKESWEEFEFRFNEVHSEFYDSLIKDFPDLTPNELKLCAFLKLNMTSKDIATITYQSNHSITVARHRLRLKLDLERDDNLISFFSKY